jgi:outer membrane protein assembly factor BamE
MRKLDNLQRLSLLVVAVAPLGLGACGTMTDRTRGALSTLTPYQVEVVQGNAVSREQVSLLKIGMPRQQVREVLGTSLLTDVFHGERWDYVFTLRRQGVEPQRHRLTLFFAGERLDRLEGDPMPSEENFVASIARRRGSGKVPRLEASEEELKKFATANPASSTASATPTAPLPAKYPPLESGG